MGATRRVSPVDRRVALLDTLAGVFALPEFWMSQQPRTGARTIAGITAFVTTGAAKKAKPA